MEIAELLYHELQGTTLTVSTAESCTGGGVAAAITTVPGSSAYFKGGVVAYSNEVKEDILGVSHQTLEKFGAVSEQTVIEMAKGVQQLLKSDCSIATSGIAGPGGATPNKPVGTIWIAVAVKEHLSTFLMNGDYGREENAKRTIRKALEILINDIQTLKKATLNTII